MVSVPDRRPTPRYNQHPDLSANSFVVKLRGQLANASDMTIQLAAEALYVVQLIADVTGGAAKRRLLQEVLSWMESPLQHSARSGRGSGSRLGEWPPAFKTLLPYQLQFVVDFGRQWKGLSRDEQEQAVTDPWAFKAFLWNVPIERGYGQREALLHLLFPDTFEDIIARDHKAKICAAFSSYATQPDDDADRRLQQIRAALTSKFGEGFSYYDPEVRPLWEPVALADERLRAR